MIFFLIILRPVLKDKLNTDYNLSISYPSGADRITKIGDGVSGTTLFGTPTDIQLVSDQTSEQNIQNQTIWNTGNKPKKHVEQGGNTFFEMFHVRV